MRWLGIKRRGGQTLRAFVKKVMRTIYSPIKNQNWRWRIRTNGEIDFLVKIKPQ